MTEAMRVRCPDQWWDHIAGTPGPLYVVGCGTVFEGTPGDDGYVDCPNCGMWFTANDNAAPADTFMLADFITGYIDCLIWSSSDQSDDSGGRPLDENYDRDDIEPESLAEIEGDCRGFVEANAIDLDAYCERRPTAAAFDESQGSPMTYAGHDFCLTRNGHGAGFWDRGLGALGERLSEAARTYGTQGLMPVSGGKLETHG